MNKAELVAAVAAKTGETKKAAEASVNAFVDVVTEALKKGDKVQLVGFGSFVYLFTYFIVKKYLHDSVRKRFMHCSVQIVPIWSFILQQKVMRSSEDL